MASGAANRIGDSPPGAFGRRIMELADRLARWSESPEGLTCTYLSPAHRAGAAGIRDLMRQAGLETEVDAVANVIGRYPAHEKSARTLIVASHYDTVRNAGKYDGRLGILIGLVLAEHFKRLNRKLPFHLDVIAFSEEEGVRFSSSFLGSRAVAGRFDAKLLERRDAEGVSLAAAMAEAGLDPAKIPTLARRREDLLGYLEVHIEQGPVLLEPGLPRGLVSAIACPGRHRERACRLRSIDDYDHGSRRPCRYRAHGAAPRRSGGRSRAGAVCRKALHSGAYARGHGGAARRPRRRDQHHSRALRAFARC